MRVVKPNQVGILSRPYDHNNHYRLGVTGLILFPFAEPRYPLSESALWLLVGKMLKETPLDESMPKRNGEILMRATAYAPHGTPHRVVRAAVELDGKLLKEIAVVGDRVWKRGVPTEPEPFVAKPIRWEDAFGGEEFKPNPLGKGYRPKDGTPLPNIEDPRKLITSMHQTPDPVGVGPYDITWPQRMQKAGTYDKEWLDKLYPGLARDLDWSFFNVAPPDQQIHGFFRGDEELVLKNLHPEKPELRFKLPEVQLRCTMRRKRRSGDEVDCDVPLSLDTVWLFPDAAHGVLVFHGSAPIREDDAADVSLLYFACEDLGRPKPAEHYARVLERRLSKETGAVASLDDRPLMPELRGGMKRPPSPRDELDDLMAHESISYKNMMKKGQQHVEAARALLVAYGLDPDEHGPIPTPPTVTEGSVEELLERLEQVEKDLVEKRKQAEESQEKMEAEMEQICLENGFDFKEIKKEWRGPWKGGPPEPSAERNIARMRKLAEEGRAAGFDVSEVDAYLADPKFVEMIWEEDRSELHAYRMDAHNRSEADLRNPAESRRLRGEIVAAHARGESLAGRDLTGVDLADVDLTGADLREALMERCDLTGANLSRANLAGAVLVRAVLVDTRLDGANLQGANLSKAECSRTSLAGCQLKEVQLIGTQLVSVSFDGANLERVTLSEATLDRCSFRGVRGEGLALDDLDLAGTSFREAFLLDAMFMKCGLDRVDFTGADVRGVTLYGCHASEAIFAKVRGKSLRVVEGTELRACDFRDAVLEEATLRGTNLVGCDFSGARAPLADFSECNLEGARLYHLSARQARFVRANLTQANLVGADLFEAMLSKADLTGADVRGANLYQADMALVHAHERAQLDQAIVTRVRTKPLYATKVQDID